MRICLCFGSHRSTAMVFLSVTKWEIPCQSGISDLRTKGKLKGPLIPIREILEFFLQHFHQGLFSLCLNISTYQKHYFIVQFWLLEKFSLSEPQIISLWFPPITYCFLYPSHPIISSTVSSSPNKASLILQVLFKWLGHLCLWVCPIGLTPI